MNATADMLIRQSRLMAGAEWMRLHEAAEWAQVQNDDADGAGWRGDLRLFAITWAMGFVFFLALFA